MGNHINNVNEIPDVLTKRTEFTSDTEYAFWILALIQFPAAAVLYFAKSQNVVEIPSVEETELNDGNANNLEDTFQFNPEYLKKKFSEIPAKELTFLIATLVFLFEGLQVFSSILTTLKQTFLFI